MTLSFVFSRAHTCTQIINRVSTLLDECKGQKVTISVESDLLGLKDLRSDQVLLLLLT